jgi:hypothetical protein
MQVGGISRIAKSIRVSTSKIRIVTHMQRKNLFGEFVTSMYSLEFDLPYSRTTAVDGRRVTGLYGDGSAVHRTVPYAWSRILNGTGTASVERYP